ncbi:hypothetical protein AJ79_03457 [Helicocarpus griseus UAMH5409]|uniref:Cytochrome P450 n=1 Tax=Helicocarpus griseus UAMH5409 TaxID=1447875 RepID=A0A2B7XYV8_9EURO|nr:hypothetical protein AJ79_03457 [Helicocarpus griseus UAMH5409]
MEGIGISIPSLTPDSAREVLSGLFFEVFIASVILVCITTRAYSGFRSHFRDSNAGEALRPKTVPYWIPYFGHAPSFGLFRRSLLESSRDITPEPVFSLHVCGQRHNIITSPSLAKALSREQKSSTSSVPFTNHVMERVFGARLSARKLNRTVFDAQCRSLEFQMREPYAPYCSATTTKEIERNMPNMLSFCSSIVDQTLWERMSNVSVIEDTDDQVCEVNLFELVRNFVAVNVMTVIMGGDFMEALPNTPDDIWKFNSNINAMVLGIQRWIPFPGLPTAYGSRRRLLQGMAAFHSAFNVAENGHDPGFDWREMDQVSEFMKSHCRTWKDAGLSADSMASESLALLWAMSTKINTIVFWNLIYILADGQCHSRIMKEIAPYSRAGRPDSGESGFRLPEPPRLSLDVDRLVDSCPSLKASYYETLRLHSCPITYRKVTKDFKLRESKEDAEVANRKPQTYQFKQGEFIAVPHTLHNTDSRYFEDPDEFKPKRFLKERSVDDGVSPDRYASSEKQLSSTAQAALELQLPETWSAESDNDNNVGGDGKFAERTALAFIAGFLTMWDIQPADGLAWKVPKKRTGGLVYEPKADVRARMSSKV